MTQNQTLSRLVVVLAVLLPLGAPALASAQMTANFLTYGPRGAPGTTSNTYFVNWPMSQAECLANTPVEVQLLNVPYNAITSLVFDVWTGGTGPAPAACETATNRRSTTGTPPCTRVDFAGPMVSAVNQVLSLPPQALFGSACTAGGDRSFFLMAVSAANDTTTDLLATHFVTIRVVLDPTAPSAPTVSDAAGDTSIALTWTNPADTGTLSSARIFVDTSGSCGSGDGGSTSSTLIAGGTPPATAYTTVPGGSPTSGSIDAAALGLAYGESAAVAVSLVDLARNESRLSNIACITRLQVEGFWDAYCRERGLSEADCRARYGGGCAVSTPGVSAPPGRLGWGVLLLGLVALVVRRRRA